MLTYRGAAGCRIEAAIYEIASKLAFGWGGGFTKFEGTIQVIDNETSGALYGYNVKKGDFQSAAEAFAKHFKNDYLANRRP